MKQQSSIFEAVLTLVEAIAEPGIYFAFDNQKTFAFTKKNVSEMAERYWQSPHLISEQVKNSFKFKRCGICPKDNSTMCDSVQGLLPIVEMLDKFPSFEKVKAVYYRSDSHPYLIKDTDLQHALAYLGLESITEACVVTKQFKAYFEDIFPFMPVKQVARQIFVNIFFTCKGDLNLTRQKVEELNEITHITTQNKIKRLGMIVKSDAFLNTISNLSMPIQLLQLTIDDIIQEQMGET